MRSVSQMLSKAQFELQKNEIELLHKVKQRQEHLIAEIQRLYSQAVKDIRLQVLLKQDQVD